MLRRRWGTAATLATILALVMSARVTAESTLVSRETEDAIELLAGEQLMLRYHKSVVVPPAGIDPVYSRSGFIHPVATPAGRVVTADFPPDHAHQHGLFNAWVKTTFEGRKVDFWNQAGRTGQVEHVRVIGLVSGQESASFTVELRHSDLSAPEGPKPVLRELWTVTARRSDQDFVFDIDSTQTCIADSALTIEEYHYGGMGYRGTSEWFSADKNSPAPFEFLTSEGHERIEGNHTRPEWVAAHGRLEGGECGLAVMGHPENFRHPQPVRLHPTKPYFVFAPCVLGAFQMEPGVAYRSRYRYILFDGPVDPARLNARWEQYRAEATADR